MTSHPPPKFMLSSLVTQDLAGLSPIQTIMKMTEERTIRNLGLDPKNVISFGGGWCNHNAPQKLQQIYQEICTDKHLFHQSGRYSAILGDHQCRTELAHFEQTIFNMHNITADNILIGQSSTQLFHDLLRVLANPGEPVCVLDPTYANYINAIKCALPRSLIQYIPALNPLTWTYLEAEQYSLQQLETHCKKGARILVIPVPDNPTSQIPSQSFLQGCYDILAQHNGFLILDMAYETLYFNNMPPCFSWSPEDKPHLITLHTNSKWLSSLGRRLGWIEAAPPIIQGLEKINESVILSPDTLHSMTTARFLQQTLENNQLKQYLSGLRKLYKNTAQVLINALTKNLDWLYLPPAGGLYTCCPTPNHIPPFEFSETLLRATGVLVIPGNGFGPSMNHAIRLSYGPLCYHHKRICEGIERIATHLSTTN
ncbi:MAG: pyridoxal phosphate-dependent aminotransferase [Candidatus Thermoplasmatota archaeon]|nr:pyridoxal phosphate-dependent aminotransferase [Candidatus Thermoplasmatota archaeon]MBU1941282.1 pyridoxal phosphate-dependent aminotransferase [Candidatus Thermoplasmatota archaeon]